MSGLVSFLLFSSDFLPRELVLLESYGYGWFIALIWVPLYSALLLGAQLAK